MTLGILVLLVFVVFALLMYARIMPAILAVPLMAVCMALVAGVPFAGIGTIVTDGGASLAPVYVAVIFGALLGRVTLDTGIARALVNLAAEYGGEQPLGLALLICAVVALLFVSLSGLGAIIMVGSIALPIMMTTGVPRKSAATLFLMAFALGFIFNIANWKFYTKFFGVSQQQLIWYAIILAAIDLTALLIYAVVSMRRERDYATWAQAAEKTIPRIAPWALLTPLLPILLYFVLHVDATPAFIISAIYGVLVTRPKVAVQTLVAAAIRGVEDIAPAILLFIGIGMLAAATKLPQFVAALHPLVAGGWIRNPVAFVVTFGVLSPLALYRGPLNPFGVGIAIFSVLLASAALPPVILVAAVMAVVQVQNVCDPTNTANVWVGNFTGTPIPEITKRTLPYQVAVAIAGSIVIVLAAGPLFGMQPFRSLIPAARADELQGGLFAPASAAGRIAIGDDGSAQARIGADAAVAALGADGIQALRLQADPDIGDCTRKPYAAYVLVTSTEFVLSRGTDTDIGLVLDDCGGWNVGEWHDHAVIAGPNDEIVRELARQGVARLREWTRTHTERSDNLLQQGLAFAAADPPTYYYALFKTVDGYMRAFVRGGGPAYDAGLRTNDIVDKLDGKFWWEYGTYQTQLRAYDGQPHSYEVERGGRTLDIQLGAPFVAQARSPR